MRTVTDNDSVTDISVLMIKTKYSIVKICLHNRVDSRRVELHPIEGVEGS